MFVATGVSVFPGAVVGTRSELRINSVVHVNTTSSPDHRPDRLDRRRHPAELFSPDRHDDLWAAQEPLDFPGTVYGVPRGTSMVEIMRRQSLAFGPDR